MTTELWATIITAVVAPAVLKIVTHFFPPAGVATPQATPSPGDDAATTVYDIEEES